MSRKRGTKLDLHEVRLSSRGFPTRQRSLETATRRIQEENRSRTEPKRQVNILPSQLAHSKEKRVQGTQPLTNPIQQQIHRKEQVRRNTKTTGQSQPTSQQEKRRGSTVSLLPLKDLRMTDSSSPLTPAD